MRVADATRTAGRHRAQVATPHASTSGNRWRTASRAGLVLVSVLILAASGYLCVTTHRLVARLHRVDAIPPGGAPGVPTHDLDADAQNVLLTASHADRPVEALAVLHLPASRAHPVLLWISPDSWTDIPGFGTGRLATAADLGRGYRTLVQAVDALTGLTINRFVLLDVSRLATIADISPVLVSCRQNRPGAADAAELIRPLLDRLTSVSLMLDPLRLERAVSVVGAAVQIDTGANPLALARQLAAVGDRQLTVTTIPVQDPVPGHTDRLAVDAQAVRRFTAHMVIDPASFARAIDQTRSPNSRHAVVLDGSGDSHASSQVADALRSAGISIDTIGQTSSATTTLIKYPPAEEGLARTIAALVPGARPMPSNAVSKVTLILGTDRVRPSTRVAAADCVD